MPGGHSCSVVICKNNSKKCKENGEKLCFFTFPKNPEIRKQWVAKCYTKDKFDPENKRICSIHFKDEDFEDNMRAKLMGIKARKLKKTAVPSLYLLPKKENQREEIKISSREQRAQKKERKALVETLLANETMNEDSFIKTGKSKEANLHKDVPPNTDFQDASTGKKAELNLHKDVPPNTAFQDPSTSKETELNELRRKLDVMKFKNKELEQELCRYKKNEQLIIAQFKSTENDLKSRITSLETQLKIRNADFVKSIKNVFKDVLSPNQIDIILNKKTKARWTSEEYSKAFTLWCFSRKCYVYLKETLHYPLPGISTLQIWAANTNLKNGILEDVLTVIAEEKKSLKRKPSSNTLDSAHNEIAKKIKKIVN